jgi:alpha-tubulin suppressor-like RCC1 family protein
MNENNSELKTNQLDSVQTSLISLIESEAAEMLSAGQNAHAKRILDACDKLFRWGSATRGQLTDEQRERLNSMSLDEVIAALT